MVHFSKVFFPPTCKAVENRALHRQVDFSGVPILRKRQERGYAALSFEQEGVGGAKVPRIIPCRAKPLGTPLDKHSTTMNHAQSSSSYPFGVRKSKICKGRKPLVCKARKSKI